MTIIEYLLMIGAIGLFFAVDWWIERPRGKKPPRGPVTEEAGRSVFDREVAGHDTVRPEGEPPRRASVERGPA